MSEATDLIPIFGTQKTIAAYDIQTVITADALAASVDQAEWSRAFHQWLDELPAENTRRAYTRAWRDLLNFTDKQPWAIRSDDIRDWIQDLQIRPLHPDNAKALIKKGRRSESSGYSPATINLYLTAVSSFYTFARERYLINRLGEPERALHDAPNPARAVRRPKVTRFGKADYLDTEAMTALLRAIPQDTVQGLRDLALILGFMLTGRRSSEWRALRWGDIQHRGGQVYYEWSGKGKEEQLHELAPPVWDMLQRYLEAAGRREAICDEDYVFTPLGDAAARLPNVSELTWHQNRPLSLAHCNALLKKYARRAGLDPTRVTVHTLRHSFAMLLSSLGVDVLTISKRLGHSNLDITLVYLDHLKGVEDHTWRQAAAALKLDLL